MSALGCLSSRIIHQMGCINVSGPRASAQSRPLLPLFTVNSNFNEQTVLANKTLCVVDVSSQTNIYGNVVKCTEHQTNRERGEKKQTNGALASNDKRERDKEHRRHRQSTGWAIKLCTGDLVAVARGSWTAKHYPMHSIVIASELLLAPLASLPCLNVSLLLLFTVAPVRLGGGGG